jgi:phytoene dehydrogenase-like protein
MSTALVLGSGVDGLAAAITLAEGGRRVRVLEESATLGGAQGRDEFHPGFASPGLPLDLALDEGLLRALGAEDLAWRQPPPTLAGAGGERTLLLERDPRRARAALSELAGSEASAYSTWRGFLGRVSDPVRGLLGEPPPELDPDGARDLLQLARTALRLRRLVDADLVELLRVAPQPVQDWLRENFADELLCTALAAEALPGSVLGPRAPGTAGLLLMRACAAGEEPVGGVAAVVDALVARCRRLGVELLTDARVEALRTDGDRVIGARLADGGELEAELVLSSLDPRRTLLELVPPTVLPVRAQDAARAFRCRGASAFVRVALGKPPAFTGAGDAPVERACTAGRLDDLERAADALKYGELPEEPWFDVRVPSAADASLAPAGAAVAILTAHGVPHDLAADADFARTRLADAAVAALERAAPGAGADVLASDVLLPSDLEARFGASGGHLHGGELALDQLLVLRPSLPLARFDPALPGLVLGGGGNHPSGAFPGHAGRLAARAALARG